MLNFGDVLFVIVYFFVVQIMFYDIEGKLSRREVNVKYNNFKFVVYRIINFFF